MLSATELHRRGVAEGKAGHYAEARRYLRTALERASSADLRAHVQATLAYVESETGHVDSGLRVCNAALEQPGVSRFVQGVIRSQQGLLLTRAGAGKDALEAFADAIRVLAGSPEYLGKAHLNRGDVYLQRGDAHRAQHDFESAITQFEVADQPVSRARAQHNLGYARMLAGDLATALRHMEAARPVLAPLSRVSQAICDQDRGEVLIEAGMSADGADALTEAARAFGTRRLGQGQGQAEYTLAQTLLLDEPRRAAVIARRASRRFARRGSDVWALRADAVAITAQVEHGSRDRGLVVRARALANSLRTHRLGHDAMALELQAVRVSLRLGDLGSARVRLGRIRTTSRTPIATRLLAREVRSELAVAERRRANAFMHVRRGLADLHAWQSSFGSLDLQSSLVGHGRRLAAQGLGLAIENGRPDIVFEWSERARTLVSRVTPLRPPANPEAAEDLTELRHLHAEIQDSAGSDSLPHAEARREAELRRRIRQRGWYDDGSGLVTEPFGLCDVRAELATTDAALAAYLLVDGRLHALVVTAERADVLDLGAFAPIRNLLAGMRADLDMSSASLPPTMKATVRAGLLHRLDAVAEHLVSPIAHLIGQRRLVITPAGALSAVPWTMLPGLVSRPLTVPRSASWWLTERHSHPPIATAGFAAGPRVARAEEEVRKAASAWSRAEVLLGDEVCAERVDELAESVDVLHISAHGRHSADNPLFSGLELCDGPWFGYDIDELDRIPSTVVLSACELGRSSIRWGEESIGMTVAWLHAGARCVIASPTSVDDDVACEVLSATHELLAGGMQPANALAEASTRVLDGTPAPFICYGAGW